MKKIVILLKKVCVLVIVFFLMGWVSVVIYMVIFFGVWLSMVIWVGGNVLGILFGVLDQVVINLGVIVIFDEDVDFDLGFSFQVDGILQLGFNINMLMIMFVNVSGFGNIMLNRLSFGVGGIMIFSGIVLVDKMWISVILLQLVLQFMLNDFFYM